MAIPHPQYGLREDADDSGSGGHLLARCETCEGLQTDALTKSKSTQRRRLIVIHGAFILSYGIITLLAIHYLNTRQGHRQSLIYCKIFARHPPHLASYPNDEKAPANIVIEYDNQIYSPSLLGDPEYFGTPSAYIDENWNRLLERMSQTSIVLSI